RTRFHETPWFVVTLATSPREPALFHRSCWYSATMFCGLVGLTATRGSVSEFGKSVLNCCWRFGSSAVQPAKGLAPGVASTGGVAVYGIAAATPTAISAAAKAPASKTQRVPPRRDVGMDIPSPLSCAELRATLARAALSIVLFR